MLRFILGPTGSGKTKYMTALALDYLVANPQGFIVTNAALKMDPWTDARGRAYRGLIATLKLIHGIDYQPEDRVIFLGHTQTEVERFFAHRPRWEPGVGRIVDILPTDVQILTDPEGRPYKRTQFTMDGSKYPGVLQIIDEAQDYFPKSEWKRLEGETSSWANKNRRAGDEAYLGTPNAEQVAIPLRRLAVECIVMTNHGYKVVGPFRQMETITAKIYRNTPPAPGDVAMRMMGIGYRKNILHHCYDTSAGAGVQGSAADVGKRAPGIHWVWSVIGAIAAVILICAILRSCVRAGTNALAKKAPVHLLQPPTNAVPPRLPTPPPKAQQTPPSERQEAPPADKAKARLHSAVDDATRTNVVIATMKGSAGWSVVFDDGVVADAQTVKREGRWVWVDGERFPTGRGKREGRRVTGEAGN